MTIDWGDAIYSAENSPRAILAEFLAHADDLSSLVVIAVQRVEVDSDNYMYRTSGSRFMALGMVEKVKHDLLSGEDEE